MALLPLFVFAMACATKAQSPVTINGTIDIKAPYPVPNSIQLYAVQEGALAPLADTPIDEQGKFTLTFIPEYKGYYVVSWARAVIPENKYRFYFEGGETLEATFDVLGYRLTGDRNSKENRILAEWDNLSAGVRNNAIGGMGILRETYQTFFPEITKFATENAGWFDGRQTGNRSFDELMTKTVPLDILFWATNFISLPNSKHPQTSDFKGTYYETVDVAAVTSDTTMLRMPFGFRMLYVLVQFPFRFGEAVGTQPGLGDLVAEISNDRLKGLYLMDAATMTQSTEELDKLLSEYTPYLDTPGYRERIETLKSTLEQQREAMSNVNFTYTDMKGDPVRLSDFRGKVVYLDFWATWCAPCRAEFPHLRKIEEHYKGNPNVVFVGISSDKPEAKAKWEKMVRDEQLPGVQLFAGGPDKLPREYNIAGIPRFVLIDRQGKVAASEAPRPSMGDELIQLIDKLLK